MVYTLIIGVLALLIFLIGAGKSCGAFRPDVERWRTLAERYAVSPFTSQEILAVIDIESGGNPNAVGTSGEVGLMQLKEIARRDVENDKNVLFAGSLNEPPLNIYVGCEYLALLYRRKGTKEQAFRAYKYGNIVSGNNTIGAERVERIQERTCENYA